MKQEQARPRVTVKLQDVGDVELVSPGPLMIRLVRMLQNNGLKFVEEWMNQYGLHGVAEDAHYDDRVHQVVKITIHPLKELLIGIRDNKLYHLTDHVILDIKVEKVKHDRNS